MKELRLQKTTDRAKRNRTPAKATATQTYDPTIGTETYINRITAQTPPTT